MPQLIFTIRKEKTPINASFWRGIRRIGRGLSRRANRYLLIRLGWVVVLISRAIRIWKSRGISRSRPDCLIIFRAVKRDCRVETSKWWNHVRSAARALEWPSLAEWPSVRWLIKKTAGCDLFAHRVNNEPENNRNQYVMALLPGQAAWLDRTKQLMSQGDLNNARWEWTFSN